MAQDCQFPCSFVYRPADPPPPQGQGRSGYFGCSDCGAGLRDFLFSLCRWYNFTSPPSLRIWRYFAFPLFRRHTLAPHPLSGDVGVVFFDVFSCPSRIGLYYFPFFLAFLVGFVVSPFRRVGVGFEEPNLLLMF